MNDFIEMEKRSHWIDATRGLGIMLVILGHCIGTITNDACGRFINSFHMPFFFFVSGICAKKPAGCFRDYLEKKTRTLLIPQATLGVINCVYDITLRQLGGGYKGNLQ